ncbi:MAG TPA: hypothetical protein EYQ06_09905 [Flavobacteriales bacterium]|nr:hypothetical protein [Flavobacteriales bacterium]HIL66935.1 hypothetical protein [Flavobacteriales bacterium]
MRKLFLATLILFSTITFAQTPSVSALSFSLDNYGLYNNWHNQSDTFFVVPIRMDSFVSGVDSFAFNVTYDDALLTPIMNLTAINGPGFILLMNYLGGAEFAIVDGGVIHTDTFDLMMGNTNKMLSISFKAQNAFTQGMYNNCGGTLMYVAFKRNNVCSGGTFNLNFINGLIGTVYINPMQTNTFLLSGAQNYSADNNTLIAYNGQISKQAMEATIAQNGITFESTVNFGVAPYAFLWNTGEITQNINPTGQGGPPWYVVVTDVNGCTDTSNYLIAIATSEIELQNPNKKIISVFDIYGRKIKISTQPLVYIYDDGTIEKKQILE